MRTRMLALIFVLPTVLASGCGDMTSGELDRRIGALESAAAEGAMVARQVADDRTKTTFARVRARELSEEVDHESEKVADSTPAPDQVANRDRTLDLAEQVGEALGTLQTHPEDEKRAAEAESDLEALAETLSRLRDRD